MNFIFYDKGRSIHFSKNVSMLILQLASCHVCKADIVFFIVFDNANICILNGNFCHCN